MQPEPIFKLVASKRLAVITIIIFFLVSIPFYFVSTPAFIIALAVLLFLNFMLFHTSLAFKFYEDKVDIEYPYRLMGEKLKSFKYEELAEITIKSQATEIPLVEMPPTLEITYHNLKGKKRKKGSMFWPNRVMAKKLHILALFLAEKGVDFTYSVGFPFNRYFKEFKENK